MRGAYLNSLEASVAQVFILQYTHGRYMAVPSVIVRPCMQAPITNLIWRTNNDAELVFGLADGSVKLGVVTRNKAYPLYQHPLDGQPVSMVCSPNGASVYVGHVDGSIYRFTFVGSEDASHSAGALTLSPPFSRVLRIECTVCSGSVCTCSACLVSPCSTTGQQGLFTAVWSR